MAKDVRHVFADESFDGLSVDPAYPTLVNPKELGDQDFNQHRYHSYLGSLSRSFPDYFPTVSKSVSYNPDSIKKCHELLYGLKYVEVVYS